MNNRLLPLNLILALVWVAVTATFTVANFLFGLLLGAGALWLVREQFPTERYFGRTISVVRLLLTFIVELTKSTWTVVKLVWSPSPRYETGFVALPLSVKSDREITLLANLITLTPGTLSVDVSDDRSTLYIHALDAPDVESLRRDIATGFEQKVREALR
ncbi:Na+/H+ antiporter subunit E [Rhodoligotrophos defluvii]|uniref:Na+/H+ antiporter subunit E n=1 Tax=Rhodoligotrophos defluvii TaxID=2561934 RepID=UPI0010CA0B6E|nr:Na+/H+ antiporter subunit E [Rhodoligotrophos defluvii]